MSGHLLGADLPASLVWIGRALRESLYMFVATLWPLAFGFALSGAIQAFATREQMERRLGDHRAPAVLRASGYGVVSSSCSYAASAMAKSLFQRGADFVTSMVFMFASTNLVIELGVVLAVLIGWRFLAAQFVGGAIMILLLTLIGGAAFASREIEAARRRLEETNGDDPPLRRPLSERLRDPASWQDAAAYAISDLKMLRFELVIGYLVAGALAVLVPASAWSALFVSGHGFWTSLENALIGPLIAMLSCVCSVGNVPLAAALWSGGISFGGVIAFLFADLISLPLLFIYRRYYGRLVWKMLPVFWGVMSAAGLLTEGIFRLLGLVPVAHQGTLDHVHLGLWTIVLDLVALAVLGALLLVHHRRPDREGRLATDPVCGMQVEKSNPGAVLNLSGERHYFCSEGCRDHFAASATPRDGAPTAAS